MHLYNVSELNMFLVTRVYHCQLQTSYCHLCVLICPDKIVMVVLAIIQTYYKCIGAIITDDCQLFDNIVPSDANWTIWQARS